MKDFLGQDIEMDANVVIITPNYRTFCKAKVIGFTPKNVRVVYNRGSHWDRDVELLQSGEQLIVVKE